MMDKTASNFFFKRFMVFFFIPLPIALPLLAWTRFVEAEPVHPPLCCSISEVFSSVNINFSFFTFFLMIRGPVWKRMKFLSFRAGAEARDA
jgi:hypothetical protein